VHWGCHYATALRLDIEVDPQRRPGRFDFQVSKVTDDFKVWSSSLFHDFQLEGHWHGIIRTAASPRDALAYMRMRSGVADIPACTGTGLNYRNRFFFQFFFLPCRHALPTLS